MLHSFSCHNPALLVLDADACVVQCVNQQRFSVLSIQGEQRTWAWRHELWHQAAYGLAATRAFWQSCRLLKRLNDAKRQKLGNTGRKEPIPTSMSLLTLDLFAILAPRRGCQDGDMVTGCHWLHGHGWCSHRWRPQRILKTEHRTLAPPHVKQAFEQSPSFLIYLCFFWSGQNARVGPDAVVLVVLLWYWDGVCGAVGVVSFVVL